MDNYDSMYSYAIEYANYGIAVFPLKEKDKTPLIKHWNTEASTDAAKIKAWWQKWPNANIGIVTGKQSLGGLYVIDCDCHNEGVDGWKAFIEWQAKYGKFPLSWVAQTGSGGVHYFFTDKEEHKNRAGIIPSVDFRGDGGYVVAPPSIHPNGERYKWNEKASPELVELASINDTMRYFLNSDRQLPQARYSAPEIIPEGERNHMLFKFACMMQAKGASDQAVYAATKAEMESKCRVPLTEKELKQLVKSALKYEKGKPIYVDGQGNASQGRREPVFDITDKGIIKQTWDNMREAIEYDEALYDKIKYNVLANSIYVFGSLPWDNSIEIRSWRNSDDENLKSFMESKYGFKSAEKIMNALTIVADKNKYNPVTQELELIHEKYGNCEGAIRKLLPEYMGATDSEYNAEVMKVYMLGAICRAFYPGCKFDYSIILYGAQGFGKSEFLRHLAINPEWFNDNFNTFDGDKAIEKLSGMWIVEMAELKALKSAKDAESFKSFLTSRIDIYRAPYSRRAEQRPRMCVFAGTTNNKNVFVDKTGNRRFLPVETRKGKEKKNLFGDQVEVMEDFKKAWAEAMDIFIKADRKPQLTLSEESQKTAQAMQEEFSEDDYRVGLIQNWLDETNCDKVCVPMLIEYALDAELSKVPKQQKREIMDIMDNEIVGWSRLKTNDKGRTRFGKYGNQIGFIRDFD